METNIRQVSEQLKKRLEAAKDSAAVEQIRVEFLGKKGQITDLMKLLKDAEGEAKRELGQSINELKKQAEADAKKQAAAQAGAQLVVIAREREEQGEKQQDILQDILKKIEEARRC